MGLIPGLGKMSWKRKWQPIPVFLSGESHGQRSLQPSIDWQATVHGVTKDSDNNLVTKKHHQKKRENTDFLELKGEGAGNEVQMTRESPNWDQIWGSPQPEMRFKGEGLGEKSRAGPEGGSPAYWEASPVTNSLVTQQALPLPGSQFHLLWGEYGLSLWFSKFFLPSVVKHVFFLIIHFKYTAS